MATRLVDMSGSRRPSVAFWVALGVIAIGYICLFLFPAFSSSPSGRESPDVDPNLSVVPKEIASTRAAEIDRRVQEIADMEIPASLASSGKDQAERSGDSEDNGFRVWKKLMARWDKQGKRRGRALHCLKSACDPGDEKSILRLVTSLDLNPRLEPIRDDDFDELYVLMCELGKPLRAAAQLKGEVNRDCMERIVREGEGYSDVRKDPDFESYVKRLPERYRSAAREGQINPGQLGYLAYHSNSKVVYYNSAKLPEWKKVDAVYRSMGTTHAAAVIGWLLDKNLITLSEHKALFHRL